MWRTAPFFWMEARGHVSSLCKHKGRCLCRKSVIYVMPLLFALVAAACGGESLAYDEAMDLLSSASERTVAGEFSVESHSVYIVEKGDSLEEYTYNSYTVHFESDRRFFGYDENRNPLSPPEILRYVVLEGEEYEFIDADQCYSDMPQVTRLGGGTFETIGPAMRELYRDYDYSSKKWGTEDGSSVTLIEFKPDPDARFSFKVQDGFLVESTYYSEDDSYGRLVGDGFDGKIVAKLNVTRFYDIGVKKEFPVPEPICE